MDSSLYKRFAVSRGFNYDYFASPASEGKSTLLFLHGFPSTSIDWRRQVAYFKSKGYGLIVPDMLGYGGTSKPSDVGEYAHSKLATDIHEIVKGEGLTNVFVIGHDWGASIMSRLAVLYQAESCYVGFGFLAVGYVLPQPPNFNYEEIVKVAPIGYWQFFSESDAPAIAKKNIDSFIDLLFPKDPTVWNKHLGPLGAARAFIEGGSRIERLEAISDKEYDQFKTTFTNNGFIGPFNYYKTLTSNLAIEEAKGISQDSLKIEKPVLYLGATRDAVSRPEFFLQAMKEKGLTPNLTYKAVDSGHWINYERADEVNSEIEVWVEKIQGCA
ncbi:Alpha/Beta hydrolase protein [Coprinopsis sp. MPI-PUGE-AT-0042]|nr:Alpha/Beta hydrolase protein [Coprinopsis sp. MPI-PUGE-AT-0042]